MVILISASHEMICESLQEGVAVLRPWAGSLQELTKAIMYSCVALGEFLSLCVLPENEDVHTTPSRYYEEPTRKQL